MLINIDELKATLDRLNQLINDYEDLHLNMYNNLSSTFFSWNDAYSKKFLVYNDIEKNSFDELIKNYKSYSDIYTYILNKYSKFGKIIYYELDNIEDIYEHFDIYISKLENILYKYDNSYVIKNSYLSYKIYNERRKLQNRLDNVRDIYSDVKDFYNNINEINLEVSQKLSNIEVKDIQEISIDDYV